jgi:hypothetical protein
VTNKSVEEVKQLLINEQKDQQMSVATIKGFMKYFKLEKRAELAEIEQKEWQQAGHALWAEQKVLFFGKTVPSIKPCSESHGIFTELDAVLCTDYELKANRESIKTTTTRKMPEKYLVVLRQCPNLEAIYWDKNFGQMVDTKFARVLEQNCPHLVHVEGPVVGKFQFQLNNATYVACPASFWNMFEPNKNTKCYKVVLDETALNFGPRQCTYCSRNGYGIREVNANGHCANCGQTTAK